MKYKEWLNIWLENYVKPSSKMRTIESYNRIIKQQICSRIGEKEINAIATLDIQLVVTDLLNCGNLKTHKGLAASSVNTAITVMHSSLKTAEILGYVTKNAAEGIKRPKIKGREVTCFTVAEQKKIEQAALTDTRSKMFGVILCLYTGLRIGELLALTWADVNFQKGIITVNKTCHDASHKTGCGRLTAEPKTDYSKRSLPVPNRLLPHLKRLKKTVKCEYVVSYGGEPLSIRSYQRSFALLLKKLKIPHKGFHSLRHTFATRAIECGMDVKTLSEILGHKNAAITLNRYVHSLERHKKNMMNRLGKMFSAE